MDRPRRPDQTVRPVRLVRARYDAAVTTDDNRRHWAAADGLSANSANSPEVRRVLRNRARYEVANNSYARGIVSTLANDVVGTGPRLQMRSSLSALAAQLFKGLELRDNTVGAKYPVTNPHQGKYRVEVSRYLSNLQYAGNSQKAWYLLADAADLPVIEVAFLNGQEAPTIETADADFNMLGIQLRGYHDFGVALQDPRAGVKSKGEA